MTLMKTMFSITTVSLTSPISCLKMMVTRTTTIQNYFLVNRVMNITIITASQLL